MLICSCKARTHLLILLSFFFFIFILNANGCLMPNKWHRCECRAGDSKSTSRENMFAFDKLLNHKMQLNYRISINHALSRTTYTIRSDDVCGLTVNENEYGSDNGPLFPKSVRKTVKNQILDKWHGMAWHGVAWTENNNNQSPTK